MSLSVWKYIYYLLTLLFSAWHFVWTNNTNNIKFMVIKLLCGNNAVFQFMAIFVWCFFFKTNVIQWLTTDL